MCAPIWRFVRGIRAGGNPTRRAHSHREGTSWKAGKNLLDLFAAQGRSIRTRAQNRETGNGVEENGDFMRARSSRCQYDAPTLHPHVERVAWPKAKLTATGSGPDHLTFR